MHVELRGKKYKLERRKKLPEGFDGFCWAPHHKRPKIETRKGLRGKTELLVYIHEMLHALEWSWNERRIENRSKDLAEALWKIGYRSKEEKGSNRPRYKARISPGRKVSRKRHKRKRRI